MCQRGRTVYPDSLEDPKDYSQQSSEQVNRLSFREQERFLQKYLTIARKFIKATQTLQLAQSKSQNSGIPTYPFVLPISHHELLVHLGNQKVDLQCKSPKRQPIPMKLSIQKRKGFSLQDQKDTKNIPKNYCKAIITFASKNQNLCLQILNDPLKVAKFLEKITVYKKTLMNIRIFSSLLSQSDDPEEEEFNRTFRILSRIFVKKYAINYIFNSKIVQHNWHLRYRGQIYKGIKSPKTFSHIKNL